MARVPRRVGVGRRPALSVEEEHLLAAVDGSFDEENLAFITGIPQQRVGEMLDQLALMGLVAFGDLSPTPRPSAPPGDGIALSAEERERIDQWAARIKVEDHYRLLGVPRDANQDEVKSAYYRLGPKFHPDKFFGRELGPYKQKIAAIFAALTASHDTLRYRKRRDAYDATLGPLKPGDRLPRRDRLPSIPEEDPPPSRGSDGRTSERAPANPPSRVPASSRPGSSSPPRAFARSSWPGSNAAPPPRPRLDSLDPLGDGWDDEGRPSDPGRMSEPGIWSEPPRSGRPVSSEPYSRPPLDPPGLGGGAVPRRRRSSGAHRQVDPEALRAHREAIARKLGRPPASPPPLKPRPITEVRTALRTPPEALPTDRSAAEVLRDRYDHLEAAARKRRLLRFLQQGRFAMQQGDYKLAAAAFEQARRLSPDDPAIAAEADRAGRLALES
jgi:curved DNA-binding protein CbpA